MKELAGRRILVTGNAGSGKSTLAREIALRAGLPCIGLDEIVWQPGWKKTGLEEREKQIRELIAGGAWVIDGVSFTVQQAADMVIFLDVPRRVCFWRVAKRNWRYLFRSRPGLPAGCPEILIVPALCRIIWNFPARVRPRILQQMEKDAGSQRSCHMRSWSDPDALLVEMKAERKEAR